MIRLEPLARVFTILAKAACASEIIARHITKVLVPPLSMLIKLQPLDFIARLSTVNAVP